MSNRYALSTLLQTVNAAVPRVLPLVWKYPPATWDEIKDVYIALNPGISIYLLSWALLFVQYGLSILTRSYAWNDRFWSLLPPLYAILFAVHPILSQDRATAGLPDARLCLIATLITLWGVRLTANAWKRGVYNPGAVDHRYQYIRNRTRWILFAPLFAVVVAACSLLLTLVTAPLYIAWLARGAALKPLDVAAALLCVTAIAAQSVADAYQRDFHKRKAKGTAAGFCMEGPFKYCRHPAYMAEISFWGSLYLFAVAASGVWVSWAGLGVLAYIALFVFVSVPLTERISAEKYAQYRNYQRRVPALLPLPTRWQPKLEESAKAQ